MAPKNQIEKVYTAPENKKLVSGEGSGSKTRTLPEAMKAYQFKPGRSGNPTGRPKGLTDPLKEFLTRKVPNDPEDRMYLEKLVQSMVKRAISKSDVLESKAKLRMIPRKRRSTE
jgi:hypothetical protein